MNSLHLQYAVRSPFLRSLLRGTPMRYDKGIEHNNKLKATTQPLDKSLVS